MSIHHFSQLLHIFPYSSLRNEDFTIFHPEKRWKAAHLTDLLTAEALVRGRRGRSGAHGVGVPGEVDFASQQGEWGG